LCRNAERNVGLVSKVSARALKVEYFPGSLEQWGINPQRMRINSRVALWSGSSSVMARITKAFWVGERLNLGFHYFTISTILVSRN